MVRLAHGVESFHTRRVDDDFCTSRGRTLYVTVTAVKLPANLFVASHDNRAPSPPGTIQS